MSTDKRENMLGVVVTFIITFLVLSFPLPFLPVDQGRAYAVNGKLSKGKIRGVGLCLVICFIIGSILFVPLDREYTAELLGFDGPTRNSMDSVSDRDYLIELLSALSTIMMHLSRFCEEIILWNSNEYRFVEIDDTYSTGSSIMPQKKNPDIAELVRGKTGRVYGALTQMLTTMKGIPLAYNKDMQEDKELTFDALETTKGCIVLFTGMISTMHFNADAMEKSAKNGFTNATDAADYLVNKGVPFRDAHGMIGHLVLTCIEKGISLDELPLDEYKRICPSFEEDIYDAISMKTCVQKRNTCGAPGPDAMADEIASCEAYLNE